MVSLYFLYHNFIALMQLSIGVAIIFVEVGTFGRLNKQLCPFEHPTREISIELYELLWRYYYKLVKLGHTVKLGEPHTLE